MNYKERYNQAIEAAKRELCCCGSLDCDAAKQIFRLFPELRKSEDERIRKAIFEALSKKDARDVLIENGIQVSDALAWLEKQGNQPSWSEEDEKMCQETIDWFEKKCFPYALENENPARESIKWLKSLRPQSHWKPTENQMSMLLAVIHDGNNANSESCHNVLQSLYNDLKSL